MRPSGMSQSLPSDLKAMDCHSSDPLTQSLMWSMEALPAEAADESFLSSIISAPLFWTRGVNSSAIHEASTRLSASFPATMVLRMSGYIVGEWLPQMAILLMEVVGFPVLRAS